MRAPRLRALLIALAAVSLAGCAGGGVEENVDPVIGTTSNGESGSAERFAFNPAQFRDFDGELEFRNDTEAVHNVHFDDPRVKDSPLMKRGDRYRVTLPEPGTYRFVCTLHPGMDGAVVWQAS